MRKELTQLVCSGALDGPEPVVTVMRVPGLVAPDLVALGFALSLVFRAGDSLDTDTIDARRVLKLVADAIELRPDLINPQAGHESIRLERGRLAHWKDMSTVWIRRESPEYKARVESVTGTTVRRRDRAEDAVKAAAIASLRNLADLLEAGMLSVGSFFDVKNENEGAT